MAQRIEDYALIGDCETAALVGRDGSIDWLCWPRFDSGAVFSALLGTPDNGRWIISPAGTATRTIRRYHPDTLILETLFETPEGDVALKAGSAKSRHCALAVIFRNEKPQVVRNDLGVEFDLWI